MTTTLRPLVRSTRAQRAGAIRLNLSVPCGPIEIVADNTVTHATVSFMGNTPDTRDLIGKAEVDFTDDGLSVRLPAPSSDSSNMSVITMIQGSGDSITILNGVRIDLRTVVNIPPNSSVTVNSVSGDIAVRGYLSELKAVSQSGNIRANHVHAVDLRSASGNITVDTAATVRAESTSGNVEVRNLAGTATVSSVSGNVATHSADNSRVCASAVTGNVTTTRAHDRVHVDLQATTVTGRIRS